MYRISNKEIALAIGKTPSAISYLKRRNEAEYHLLKMGLLCEKLGIGEEDLHMLRHIKNMQNNQSRLLSEEAVA